VLLVYKHWLVGSLHVPELDDDEELEQQGWPVPPHCLQVYRPVELSERHCVPASEQVLPAQHGPPVLPQAAHTAPVYPGVEVQLRS